MKEKIYTGVICSAATSLIINDFNLTSIESIAVFLGSFVAIVFAPLIVASSPIMFKSRLNYSLFQNLCLIISFIILAGNSLSSNDEIAELDEKYNKLIMQKLDEPIISEENCKLSEVVKKSLDQCMNGGLGNYEKALLKEAIERNLL